MAAELRTERRGATLLLTLSDQASRNRIGSQALAAGVEALNVADSDPGLRCVVLRGDGADFCVGAALERTGGSPADGAAAQWRMTEQIAQFAEALQAFPGPVIAAVEGTAAGAGLALLLACDLVVAASDARFEAGLDLQGADRVARTLFAESLPRTLALEWLWQLDAPHFLQRLHACAAINLVCAPGRALAEAEAMAARLCALGDAALERAKAEVDAARARPLAARIAQLRDRLTAQVPRLA